MMAELLLQFEGPGIVNADSLSHCGVMCGGSVCSVLIKANPEFENLICFLMRCCLFKLQQSLRIKIQNAWL